MKNGFSHVVLCFSYVVISCIGTGAASRSGTMADGTGGPQAAAWNLVPVWDGRPETFSHFIHEVKWSLSASRKDEKALLAAKIIRKALQSGQPTLVQLMYKLDPSDYTTEADVTKLIQYLEASPLNRQALPDAGKKIGSYYRRLRKRPNENVPAFLIREDRTHEGSSTSSPRKGARPGAV